MSTEDRTRTGVPAAGLVPTGVPEADVWGSARFYTLLTRKDPGLRVCQGLSCKLAGSVSVVANSLRLRLVKL